MRNYVIINGVNSLTIPGLAIKSLPPITKPIQRTLREEIDGRDGDIITELGYGAYDKEIEIGLFGDFDVDQIIAYFNQKGTITFSNEPDKVYYFQALNQVDYEELIKFREAGVELHCQPFKYPITEEPLIEEYEYVTGSGETITLNNTEEAIFNEIEQQGNTSQETTTGKNILKLDFTNDSPTAAGLTFSHTDSTFSLSGTATSTYKIFNLTNIPNITSGETYTLSASITGTNPRTQIGIYFRNSNNNNVTSIIINTPNVTKYTKVLDLTGITNATFVLEGLQTNQSYNLTCKLQLEKSATATDWEPYTGGNPAPNPDYPEDIHVVTGNNEIKIRGKNWYDINSWSDAVVAGTGASIVVGDREIKILNPNNVDAYSMTGVIVSGKVSADRRKYLIQVEPNTTYTFVFDATYDGGYAGIKSCYYNLISKEYDFLALGNLGSIANNEKHIKQITTNSNTYYLAFRLGANPEDTEITYSNLMIVKGAYTAETIGDYEEFAGDEYELNLGKNLLTFENIPNVVVNGVTRTSNNSELILDGTTTQSGSLLPKLGTGVIIPKGTYYLSITRESGTINRNGHAAAFYIRDKNNTQLQSVALESFSNEEYEFGGTVVFSEDSEAVVEIYCNGADFEFDNLKLRMQLEKGIEKTTFAQYFPPIEMLRIPNTEYHDTFIRGNDEKWYLHKETGKVILNGSETIQSYTTSVSGHFRYFFDAVGIKRPSGTGEIPLVLSNRYVAQILGMAGSWGAHQGISVDTGGDKIVINDDTYYTQDSTAYETWLQSNNVIADYALAIPTDTEITGDLADQLEALWRATSKRGQTNITQTNNDMPFFMIVSAMKLGSDVITIPDGGNIYSKPTIKLEGTGIVDIYLNDVQEFEVDLTEDNEITIDTEKMEAYTETGLANRKVTGDYSKFKLQPGDNEIRFSGDLSKATITRYTRWL